MRAIYVSATNAMPEGCFPGGMVRAASLAQALRDARQGDVVLLDSETTHNGGTVVTGKQGLRIGSYGRGRAVIDAKDGNGLCLEGCRDVVLAGLVFRGAGWNRSNGGGLCLSRCAEIKALNIETSGFGLYGIQYRGCERVLLGGCYTWRNGEVGIRAGDGDSSDIHIRCCTAIDNPGTHRAVPGGHSGSGIIISHTDTALVEYCEAAGNGWAQRQQGFNGPVGIWSWGNARNVVFRHCIAHHNRTQPGCGDGDGFDFDGGTHHSRFEHCYSYCNEAAGFLLCEYGSDMGWADNAIRCCVSLNDACRVPGYGSIHLDCPPGTEMTGSMIGHNLLVPSHGAHAVENTHLSDSYTAIQVRDNYVFSDLGLFAAEPQPQIAASGNRVFGGMGGIADPPVFDDPRALADWPVFDLLQQDRQDSEVVLSAVGQGSAGPAGRTRAEEHLLFTFHLDGADFEGSFLKGDCALAYDSLRPGMSARMRGAGAEIATLLPDTLIGRDLELRATGRLAAGDVAACLFACEADGTASRAWFGGPHTRHGTQRVFFRMRQKGARIGVRLQRGSAPFFAGSIEVYDAEARNQRSVMAPICVGDAWIDADGRIELRGGGSKCHCFATLPLGGVLTFEARAEAGLFFTDDPNGYRTVDITSKGWRRITCPVPNGACVDLGFMIAGIGDKTMQVRNIYFEKGTTAGDA